MHVSTKARYAVAAMTDLAYVSSDADVRPVSLKDIAQRQELPLSYMEQIFLKLRKANLVHSHRGAQGGYTLTRGLSDVRISDIIYAVDGPIHTTRCAHGTETGCMTNGQRCATHHLWEGLGQTIHDYLRKTTLFDVVQGRGVI